MTKKKKVFCLLWMVLVLCAGYHSIIQAQVTKKLSVRGIVLNESGNPLEGSVVNIANEDSTFRRKSIADEKGVFNFYDLPKGIYHFQIICVGYNMSQLYGYRYDGEKLLTLSATLSQHNNMLNDIVVVGYGTQKKIDLTGAVSQVDGQAVEDRSIPNVTQGLEGLIPNLNLVMGDGKPIQSPTYNVRGNTSIGQGGSALVLIDGIEGDPSLLNPYDVATVTVLKDAASASIYGARGAYGVVLITTKSANKNRTNISYSSDFALKKVAIIPDIVSNGYQYASMFDSAWTAWNSYSQTPQNINKTQPFSQAYLQAYKEHDANPSLPKTEIGSNGNYVYYGNTNWYDLLYRKYTQAVSENLTISGNTEKASYYVSGRYYNQNGIFRYNSDRYHMYNLLSKGEVTLFPWLKVYNNTQYSNRFYHNPLNVGESGSIWRNMEDEGHPSSMLYNPDGSLTFSAAYTVGDFAYGKNGIDMTVQMIRNTAGFISNFFKNRLQIKGDLTYQGTFNNQKQLRVQVPYSTAPGKTAYVGTSYNDITIANANAGYIATNLYGSYEDKIGQDHAFKFLLGFNYEQSDTSSSTVSRNGLIYSDASELSLALGSNTTTTSNYEKWAILGGFYRLNYAYKDRYLFETNGRLDGSSKFPSNQRYGFFPSVSVGWRISGEPFWKISQKAVSDLKIRASYGSLGNGNVAPYSYQEQFTISQLSRVIGGVLPQYTSAPTVLPNNLTWETATTADLGIDGALLSNRLAISADIYRRKTTNMFTVGTTLPAVFGASVPKGNYADMRTDGWELSIAWKDEFRIAGKPMKYNISAWLSDYTATILKYNNNTGTLTDHYKGEKLGSIWGYVNDGYWNNTNVGQAATMQAMFKASNAGQWLSGDIKFKDLNGDGVINNGANTLSNHGDMKIIGNSTPRYRFGFNLGAEYNHFYFSAFFQGVLKQDWWPGAESELFWGQYNRPYNYVMKSQLGKIWSEDKPNSYFPRYRGYVAIVSGGELYNAQSKYLQKVRYIRLKNLQIGYNLPKELLRKIHSTGGRIYISGENLWSASPLYKNTKALDVENIGASDGILTSSNYGNGNNYPILESLALGLQINF